MGLQKLSTLFLCAFAVFVIASHHGETFSSSAETSRREPAVEISLRANKEVSAPGEAVDLEELVSAKMKAEVRSVRHTVLRIGSYDKKTGKLVNLDSLCYVPANPDKDFEKLPGFLTGSHTMDFDITTPKQKGLRFVFRPKRLGIYLIIARWSLEDGKVISSQPWVLVVKPPTDTSGRAIVKPEWLEQDK
jgi:hypothetical protein